MNISRKNAVLLGIAGLGIVAAVLAVAKLLLGDHSLMDFTSDHAKYDAIVAEVDQQLVYKDSLAIFRLADDDDPHSLRPMPKTASRAARGQGAGTVWGYREDRRLRVWIETYDGGHAGESGFAYSSDASIPDWEADRFGEHWQLGNQVDAHWWAIFNNLD